MNCLTPGCKGKVTCRNLCWNCYQAAARCIKKGKTTWAELEKKGWAGPRQHGPGTNLFMVTRDIEGRHVAPEPYVEKPKVTLEEAKALVQEAAPEIVEKSSLPPWEVNHSGEC